MPDYSGIAGFGYPTQTPQLALSPAYPGALSGPNYSGIPGFGTPQASGTVPVDSSGLNPDLSTAPPNFGALNTGMPGVSPTGFGGGFGMNIPTFQLGLGALGTLGGLITGFGQMGLAQKSLAMNRAIANANLSNQTQTYNTNLADNANVRAAWEGQSPAQAAAYIAANSLKPRSV